MIDARWLVLKEILVGEGWQWRDQELVSPHATMWFTTSADRPHQAQLRNALTEPDAPPAASLDQQAVQADLVSLVAALDAILGN